MFINQHNISLFHHPNFYYLCEKKEDLKNPKFHNVINNFDQITQKFSYTLSYLICYAIGHNILVNCLSKCD